MQLIHCTTKLQKEMGLKKADLCEVALGYSYLDPWHGNLFLVDCRKCVLFVNGKKVFNLIPADVSRAQIRDLGGLFNGMLRCVLADEGFDALVLEGVMPEYGDGRIHSVDL